MTGGEPLTRGGNHLELTSSERLEALIATNEWIQKPLRTDENTYIYRLTDDYMLSIKALIFPVNAYITISFSSILPDSDNVPYPVELLGEDSYELVTGSSYAHGRFNWYNIDQNVLIEWLVRMYKHNPEIFISNGD